MHFPDGGKAVLRPGMVATIQGGSFYQLENTGNIPMVLMGNRSGPQDAIKHINYETRKDIKHYFQGGPLPVTEETKEFFHEKKTY
jgi:hypothetical protein